MKILVYFAACFVLGALAGLAVGLPVAYLYCGLIAIGVSGVIYAK